MGDRPTDRLPGSRRRVAAWAALLAALVPPACSMGGSAKGAAVVTATDLSVEVRRDLAAARVASAAYHQVERADSAGYAVAPPPAPLHECIEADDGHGAMGLHFINGAYLDARLDVTMPEVLVYEPRPDGRVRLVALEYVVFEDAWRAEHGDTTPQLFGRDLTYVGEGNRYELPPFFQIHLWAWKQNPFGMFADHNPRVTCPDG